MLTEQQREAVLRRETSVVLSSGAGCGKTHVLTRRYLSHLEEDGAEVGQIVAITFTRRSRPRSADALSPACTGCSRPGSTDSSRGLWPGGG